MKKTIFLILFSILFQNLIFSNDQENLPGSFYWTHPEKVKVENSQLSYTKKKYKHSKTDSAFFLAYFNDGWILKLNFVTVNIAVVNECRVYLILTAPDGTAFETTHKIKLKNIIIKEDRLYISDKKGDNIAEGKEMRYTLNLDFKGFSCDLVYDNLLPSWSSGPGTTYFTKKKDVFIKRFVTSPWAMVKGNITFNDKSLQVDGVGYSDKSLTVMPVSKMAPYLHALRIFSSDETPLEEKIFLGILNTVTHKAYGSKELPVFTVVRGKEWLFTTDSYVWSVLKEKKYEGIPYKCPQKIKIKGSNNGYILEGYMEVTAMNRYTDLLSDIPAWIKNIILLFVDRPVYFHCQSEFNGSLTKPGGKQELLNLKGSYTFMIVK